MSAYDNNDMRPDVFEPDESHPLRDDFAIRAARFRARQQPSGVPFNYNLFARNHPSWTGNNELGLEVGFSANANNQQTVLKMDEWGFPEMWTVHLGMAFDPEGIADEFAVSALVNFGSGGATQTVVMDWPHQGFSFSAIFNAVNIIALYDNAVGVPDDLRLRVTLGHGPKDRTTPTFTRAFQAAPSGSTTRLLIPNFARRLKVVNLDRAYSANTTYRLHSFDAPGNIVNVLGTEMLQFTAGAGLPLPNLARYVSVANADAINPAAGRYIFELDL